MIETAGEYRDKSIKILMERQSKNFKPYEVRERIHRLLEIESRAYIICQSKQFIDVCPYCGWYHR